MDMKRLSARNRENIIKEIRAHSQMDHPNIIKMIDFMERGQFIYILLEYAPSGNLFHFINSKPMSQDFICKLFTQVAMAIDHVHSKGFIHRDLKPENILLDGNMNAQLCDFGWAASFNDTEYRYQTAGTYEYMSPEALQNRAQNKEADVWALGVLLYELHHIQEPFPGRSSREVLESIRRKKVEFFRDVPIEARNLILEILAIEPEKRPTIRKILSSPYLQKYNRGSLGQTNPTHSAPLNPFVSNRFAPSPQTRDEQNYKSNPQAG